MGSKQHFVERFCARTALTVPVVGVLVLWLLVALGVVSLTMFRDSMMAGSVYISVTFFVYMFACAAIYYLNRSILVDADGMIILGALSFRSIPWEDVYNVEVSNVFFPGYVVQTKRGYFGFSAMVFSEHKRLHDLIVRNSMCRRTFRFRD